MFIYMYVCMYKFEENKFIIKYCNDLKVISVVLTHLGVANYE